MNYYILLALSWTVYLFSHSLFASLQFKEFFKKYFSVLNKYYRILYSFFSLAGLILLLILNASKTSYLFQNTMFIKYLSMAITAFGVIIIRAAFRSYSLKSFLGVTPETNTFSETGILKHIRHPIYSGMILIIIGFFLFSPTVSSLVTMICVFTYLPIGIILEERKLVSLHGETYLDYKKRVPPLFPLFWKRL